MENKHSEGCCHNHEHNGIFGKKTDLYFAILSGLFFFVGIVMEKLLKLPEISYISSYAIAYIFGGYYTTLEAAVKIRKGEFEIDFLMIAAAISAAYIGSFREGALLLFLFSLGHALESYAMNKAKKSIKALGNLSPKTALVKRGNGVIEIPVEALKLNDIIVVKPNTKISADGVIITGSSSINQSSITGESIPVDKIAISDTVNIPKFNDIDKKNVVFTGTINGDNSIEVQVLKLNKDSTISRLIKMVSEAEAQKSPTQLITKKFEKIFVPSTIILVVILCFAFLIINETFKESLYRAISVLVAASPCALAISTPSAVLSGIARAAKSGVLIKGGRALEDLGSITTIAFDKTGTLTEGKPKLMNVLPLNGFGKKEFLELVLDVQSLSNHPLSKSIAKGIKLQYDIENKNQASNIKEIQGKGVSAKYHNTDVFIGNTKLITDKKIEIPFKVENEIDTLVKKGYTITLVAFNNKIIGLLSLMDTPRKSAASTLMHLKNIGIKKMIMLTGDNQNVGNSIAKQIGLTEVKGNLLPEDKVKAIQELKQRDSKIAMVGDGVNDAPAMANSTIGIAMGAAGSDVALETADVALMSDKIENLPFVIGLSRKSKAIIKQNIWISLGIIAFLIPITITGLTSIGGAVIIHEGSTLLVVLNALRILSYKLES